jgi:hypothetical protein
MPRQQSPRTFRIVSASLAVIWLCAGVAAFVIGAVERRWLLSLAGLAGLWYGVIWVYVARQRRQLTLREALMPWRLKQRDDV